MGIRANKVELTKRQPPPGLNVILGDSAGGTFKQSFGAENLLVDPDVLSCGPTPKCADFDAWGRMRLDYWNGLIPDEPITRRSFEHGLLSNAPRLREAERVNLWFATSLSEQLSVAFTLDALETMGVDRSRVYLVAFEHQPGRAEPVRGMGELDEERMAAYAEPVALTAETRADYGAAWAAMTAEDPRGFERFASERPGASPWLKRAMELMLRRFPDKQTGLPYWDRVLLGYASPTRTTAVPIIANAIGRHWAEGDFVGDTWMFGRLLKLGDARLPRPLLTIAGDRTTLRGTEVALTDFGRDVLEGRESYSPTNPIWDWAAGVKLSSAAGNVWLNDGGRLVQA
jgi:hypothetical protein